MKGGLFDFLVAVATKYRMQLVFTIKTPNAAVNMRATAAKPFFSSDLLTMPSCTSHKQVDQYKYHEAMPSMVEVRSL